MYEVNADGIVESLREGVVGIPQEQARLPHSRVADEHEFKQAVAE